MKIEKTIINEATIGPSRISVRITISEENGGFHWMHPTEENYTMSANGTLSQFQT